MGIRIVYSLAGRAMYLCHGGMLRPVVWASMCRPPGWPVKKPVELSEANAVLLAEKLELVGVKLPFAIVSEWCLCLRGDINQKELGHVGKIAAQILGIGYADDDKNLAIAAGESITLDGNSHGAASVETASVAP